MISKLLLQNLRNIPDFPKPGIQFKDLQSVFLNPECLHAITEELYSRYKDRGITKVVALESRGFVTGALLADRLNAGFVMCRKPGKLPGAVLSESYRKEYGTDTLQIEQGIIGREDRVLLHDDLLATGGSMAAAYRLVTQCHPQSIDISFLLELRIEGLHGRDALPAGITPGVLAVLNE